MKRRILANALLAILPIAAQELQQGKVVERVVCRSDERQSYALYLPTSYSAERAWPIVYCLDPGARGRAPVERFAEAAEKYGYVIAGSNNSRNGPFPPIVEAIGAMVVDTHMRFNIDDSRLYAAGHSGGAMAALEWAQNGKLAGVVACSSTHAANGLPQQNFRIFGAAGIDDFAYYNMHALSRGWAKRGIENRFREFPGGHEWLPADAAGEALQFFAGKLPPAPAADSKEVRKLAARFEQMTSQLFRAEEAERSSLLRQYTRDAAKTSDGPERRLARQILDSAYIANAEEARERLAKKEYAMAARSWEVNVQIRPANAGAWYSLAVAQAASGNKRRALEALEKAAANGYKDAARMDRDPLLAPVRNDRRYRAVLESLTKD